MEKLNMILQLISCIGFYVIAVIGIIEYIWIQSAWILFAWFPIAVIGWIGEAIENLKGEMKNEKNIKNFTK